jgi:hypothetical protein
MKPSSGRSRDLKLLQKTGFREYSGNGRWYGLGDKCEKALIEGLLADWTEPEPKAAKPENQLLTKALFPRETDLETYFQGTGERMRLRYVCFAVPR